MLNDITLENTLKTDIIKVLMNRTNQKDENQSPEDAIKAVADELASAIAGAVSAYVRSANVIIGPSNVTVTSPAGPCIVTSASPANLQ